MMTDGLQKRMMENRGLRSKAPSERKPQVMEKKSFESPTIDASIEQKGKQKGGNAARRVTGENVDGGKGGRRKGGREGIPLINEKT